MSTSILEVSGTAGATAITTKERVKALLNISGTAEDAYLDLLIPMVSADIINYLGVEAANDGTRTIGKETLVQTFRLDRVEKELILARTPIVSITSIVEDDALTLDPTFFEIDKRSGLLRRLDGSVSLPMQLDWFTLKIVVTYVAGWVLPAGTSGSPVLPPPIEAAAVEWIKMIRAARTRDPLVKSVDVFEVQRTDYWVGGLGGSNASKSIPPVVSEKLDFYLRDLSM